MTSGSFLGNTRSSSSSAAPIVAFTGRIASGKSGLARALADHLGVPRASFAEHIRRLARESAQLSSLPPRVLMQNLGEELAANPAEFCRQVLASVAGWQLGHPLVIDGVRHVTVWNALVELFEPLKVFLVYVDSGEARRDSLLQAEGYSTDLIAQLDMHSTEKDVRWKLAPMADVVLDDATPVALLVELSQWLDNIWPEAGHHTQKLADRLLELRRDYRAITSDELALNDPSGEADPRRWHEQGRILAFPDPSGLTIQYPEFQFTYDAKPYRVLAKLISEFREAGIGDEGLFSWLVEPNEILDWMAPADELKREEDILKLAQSFLRHGNVGGTSDQQEYVPSSTRLLQKWTGIVLEANQDAYLARLRRENSEEEAMRWFDRAEVGEHVSLARGSVFEWTQLSVVDRPGVNLWVVDVEDPLDKPAAPDPDDLRREMAEIDAARIKPAENSP